MVNCIECGAPQKARGLCQHHYDKLRRAGQLERVQQTRTNVLLRDELDNKLCIRCRKWLPETKYSSNISRKDGLAPYCRPCVKDLWVMQERDRRYGLPVGTIQSTLDAQGYRCAICSDKIDNSAQVDHDHECCPKGISSACGNCVRGVLCKPCNMLLGSARDSVKTLLAAAAYLEGWKRQS